MPEGVKTVEPEQQRILTWQVELMVSAGINPDDAIWLAESGVSWHDVADLRRRGCPAHLVTGILAQT